MTITEQIIALFAKSGQAAYYGEDVTQTEHALQAAYLAEQANSRDALVVAALLHDIGHLVDDSPEDIAQQGVDARHEDHGAVWLQQYFGQNVTEPIRMHVDAKRYLCATEPGYYEALSEASKLSLQLQGGVFAAEEVAAFEQNPHFRDAVTLRHWDDAAKIPDLPVPDLEHYRSQIEAVLAHS